MTLPKDWQPVRFDQFALLQRGKDLPKTRFRQGTIPVAGSAGVIGLHAEANVMGPGVTVGRSGSCGTIRYYPEAFFAHNTALYVKDFFGNEPRYVAFFLEHFQPARFRSGVSVPTLDRNQFRNEIVAVPDAYEQRQIARVLATLRRAIEQQQAIIATTRELKRSLMHKLFTEGLRGEAQKPTEIGLVPESWEVVPLGNCGSFLSGGTPSKGNPEFWDGDIPWVSPKDMKKPYLDDTIDHISAEGLANASKLAPSGSLLIVVRGMIMAKAVPVAVTVKPMAFNQDMKALLVSGKTTSAFLLYVLQYHQRRLLAKVGSSAHGTKTLLSGELLRFPIPMPNRTEQDKIVASLSTLDDKLSLAERKRSHYTDLFKTLLHQLMTAQLRVHDLDLDALGVPALD